MPTREYTKNDGEYMTMKINLSFKRPKNTEKYFWTDHSVYKMAQYGLSVQRIIRIIRNPQRTEEGIVKNTIAVMQPVSVKRNKNGKKIWSSEIWAMYQLREGGAKSKSEISKSKRNLSIVAEKNKKLRMGTKYQTQNVQFKIISAWRYPGVSSKRNPVPEEILKEIADEIE